MERTLLQDLHAHIGEEIRAAGSIDVRRDHGKIIFFDLRDRTGTVQMVALRNHEGVIEAASEIRPESAVLVRAIVNKRPEKMVNANQLNGDVELEILAIEPVGKADELPFEKGADLNIDTELDYRPLTLRTERARAIFTVQHEIIQAYRTFLINEGFKEFEAPKIVGDDAEGGGNIFKVEYFKDRTAYLATSPQLYKQIMVGVFERVFSIGNVFRAEKHSTTRHLNEYTSLDIEYGFIESHADIMALENRLMHFIVDHLASKVPDAFALLGAELPRMPDEIPHLKLREAQSLIKDETGEDCTKEPDLEPAHERWLCEWSRKEYDSDFIFITHYPTEKRPFYTHDDPEDPGFTKSFDLLFRGIEVTTGGQRIHDYHTLTKKMETKGLDPANFSFYLQAFKYGMPPHGGWGMGLERLTQKFLQLDNVKEATLFPREINRIDTLLSQ